MSRPPQNDVFIETSGDTDGPRRRRDGCTECRRKKVKCDLKKPVCTRCTRFPRGCSYDLSIVALRPAKSRSPQTMKCRERKSSLIFQNNLQLAPAYLATPLVHQIPITQSVFLSSDESKFLMHIFGTQTANMLFPTAPDYFLRTMISAAMETPHLLYALLAIACSHHGRLVKDSTPKPKMTCLKYTNLAISNLRETIKSQDQSLKAETVTTAMVLCTNDVCNGNMQAWRTHLRGVLRLLAARLEHQKDFDATEEPFIWALTKWFKTMDIIAALSGFDGVCIHDPGNGPLDKSPSTENVYIDDICGYSLVLIPLLARVSELVRLQSLRHVPSGIDSSNGPSLETMVEIGALETKILSLSDKIAPSGTEEKDKHLAIELKSTHLAFVHTALLHLHRRVQLLPTHHSKVRLDIENILDALNNIQPSSPANILILWPIFSAGCETTIVTERDMIQERMTKMQGLGMGNFTRARELLQRFWESESNLPWDIYFAQHGLELVLF